MKISYRTHPILEKLEKGKLGKLTFSKEDIELNKEFDFIKDMAKQMWEGNIRPFSKKIQFITAPFWDAILLAKGKLLNSNLFNEVLNGEHCGTFIRGSIVFCYNISPTESGERGFTYLEFRLLKDQPPILASFYSYVEKGEANAMGYVSEIIKMQKDYPGEYEHLNQGANELILMINFIRYAEIETKLLAAGQRLKGVNCKYTNETKSNVMILDSKWFTTLVKSDAFKVRGHFRLQPKKKQGEWTKELIWITDFIKTGYTATARKLAI